MTQQLYPIGQLVRVPSGSDQRVGMIVGYKTWDRGTDAEMTTMLVSVPTHATPTSYTAADMEIVEDRTTVTLSNYNHHIHTDGAVTLIGMTNDEWRGVLFFLADRLGIKLDVPPTRLSPTYPHEPINA